MHSVVGGGGGGNAGTAFSKVVATLRADGNVYPTDASSNNNHQPHRQLSNLLRYEIRTENELLQNKGNSATTVVDLGKQLLQYARDSDVAGVKKSLAHGAPFTSDWLGMSALHFAAMNNQVEICEILLQGGINMDAKTKVDRTPLHLACYYGNEQIVALLLALKCSVNLRDMLRMTALHWAVEKKHKSIVRLLLRYNADVTICSKFGNTPIALAVLSEQADILTELEAARQAQANRKLNEETEKETSEAVNSIMDEPESTRMIDDNDLSVDDKMDVLETLRGQANMLGNSALNMLKTHGIADMMQDNDDDASKEMLNTALRNGRQLVLSEGGRMLLHETKSNSNTKQISNGFAAKNNSIGKVTQRSISNSSNSSLSPQKMRMNVIKQKETGNPEGITKNKNIRIISLNDYKKLLLKDGQSKTIQKIPASLASSGVVRQLADGTKLVNMAQLQSRQLKLPTLPRSQEPQVLEEQQQPLNAANPATTSSRGQVGTVQTLQLRPLSAAGAATGTTANNGTANKISTSTVMRSNRPLCELGSTKSPNVMPLLSTSEICRQLHELRRHNEELRRYYEESRRNNDELRRRIDTVQNENGELMQRMHRLEQLLPFQDTDEDVQYVDD